MKFVTPFVVLWLLATLNLVSCQKSDKKREKAIQNSGKVLTGLYVTLRNIAFPKSPLQIGSQPTSNRFVLMSPGKVLNYWDYYPGPDYEESLLRRNSSAPEEVVPPSVMEKWFDIADVMVGADPFTGGITARSMARAYETILAQMKLLGLEQKTNEIRVRYNLASAFLNSPIPDPQNLTMNTTRLALYDRFQTEYSEKKLDMEEKISEARKTRGYIEYQLWFQRNYPLLNTRVKGAYTKWLTLGEKELVELHKANMEGSGAGAELGEARMDLRASGVQSLDRTRTIYPVSFEPGNWYKYLLPKQRPVSRDMLIARKSMLESELSALRSMIKFNNNSNEDTNRTLNQLQAQLNRSSENKENDILSTLLALPKCVLEQQSSNSTSACQKYQKTNNNAVSATFDEARLKSEYTSASFLLNSRGQFSDFLQERADNLQTKISSIKKQLNATKPSYLGELAGSREFSNLNSVLNETEQSLDDAWTEFQFDSDSSSIGTKQQSFSLTTSLEARGDLPLPVEPSVTLGITTSLSGGITKTDLEQALSSANLKASGKLLRVVIKRPWFRPNLFLNPSLYFVQRDENVQRNTYVSPGPQSEKELRDSISGAGSSNYLLPEYVSSFLLARDITLQFSGVDSKTASQFMQIMAQASLSGTVSLLKVNPINIGVSLNANVGGSYSRQSTTVDRTANGMIINVPGAQIIGYYTEVLPRFPQKQGN